jgi:hypothetical protein
MDSALFNQILVFEYSGAEDLFANSFNRPEVFSVIKIFELSNCFAKKSS